MENRTKSGAPARRHKAQEAAGEPKRAVAPSRGRSLRRTRTCLMCGRSFESDGAHNRICRRCKASQTYRGA